MDEQAVVARLVGEILRRLAGMGLFPPPRKMVAVLTGGTIGVEEAFNQLEEIYNLPVDLTVVLSRAAEDVIGAGRIAAALPGVPVVTEGERPGLKGLLEGAAGVLVPVLTYHTAVRVAATLPDTLAANLILQALMLGKPVVAARNAADPDDPVRRRIAAGPMAEGLRQAMRERLELLTTYGMTLVDVKELAASVRGPLPSARVSPAGIVTATRTLTAALVMEAARAGRRIEARPGTVITPLARDLARDYGVEICIG